VASGPTPDVRAQLGAYRLEAVLGRGGMGIGYRATDTWLARQVAPKVLPPQYGGDETFRTRFLCESRVAASIDHPGVIPIYEAGEAEGQLYIAMRHVDGADRGALLREEGVLEPEWAVELGRQLAEAVDAAQAAGLVHRDIKPSNALVGTAGGREHVYLCDFRLEQGGDRRHDAVGHRGTDRDGEAHGAGGSSPVRRAVATDLRVRQVPRRYLGREPEALRGPQNRGAAPAGGHA
jgi:hypothetical protein